MKLSILFSLVFFSIAVYAASPEYIVYYTKGKTAKKGAASTPLKKGDALSGDDVIVLADKSELILICRNYNTIQLKQKGEIHLNTLKQCSQQPSSLTASYFHYVWDELLGHHGSPEKDPRHYMRNKGAVSRGCATVQTNLNVDTIYYAGGSLPVYWKSAQLRVPYISFYAGEHDNFIVFKEKLAPHAPVHLEKLNKVLKDEGEYYWQITDEHGSLCEKNYLKVLSANEYKKQVDSLLQSVVQTSAAETALMKGYILEENHFLAEALKYYTEAKKREPHNQLINKAYIRFYEIN